ncbi:hypothetical protein AgCh_022924 [Apium graveolens]
MDEEYNVIVLATGLKEYILSRLRSVDGLKITVEDGNTLVIQSNGKRKREDGEQEFKYLKLERKLYLKNCLAVQTKGDFGKDLRQMGLK